MLGDCTLLCQLPFLIAFRIIFFGIVTMEMLPALTCKHLQCTAPGGGLLWL